MKIKKSAAMAAMIPNVKTTAGIPATTAARPAVAASKPTTAAPAAPGAVTTIDVKVDAGFGNAVFLRGMAAV